MTDEQYERLRQGVPDPNWKLLYETERARADGLQRVIEDHVLRLQQWSRVQTIASEKKRRRK